MKTSGVLVSIEAIKALEGDTASAIVLSQIAYWFRPAANGKKKVRVYRQGSFWLAKSATHWNEELGLTNKQAYRAMNVLVEKGLIERKLMRFNGAPTSHIRLTEAGSALVDFHPKQNGLSAFVPISLPPKGNGNAEEGSAHAPAGKSITETSAETTAGDYTAGTPATTAANEP